MSTKIIGTFEQVRFPEFHNAAVTAKIDTGAYTGALHCSHIEEIEVEGGKVLSFVPLGSVQPIQKDEFVVKYVKSSNGERESRYFIATYIVLGAKKYKITLSLADRSDMKWPVLIGRRFLKQHHFLIDPTVSNVYGVQARKNK